MPKNKQMKRNSWPKSGIAKQQKTPSLSSRALNITKLTPEITEAILSYLQQNDIPKLLRTGKHFADFIKTSSTIQTILTGVPSPQKALQERLSFRSERIEDFMRDYEHEAELYLHNTTDKSCYHGFKGEKYINRTPPWSMKDLNCAQPCTLQCFQLSSSNLATHALKRALCRLIASANGREADQQPMVPFHCQITCDASRIGCIDWLPFGSDAISDPATYTLFSEPFPCDTLAATATWALCVLWENSEFRPDELLSGHKEDNKSPRRIACRKQIQHALKLVRSRKWTAAQHLCIIDNIKEESLSVCRRKCGTIAWRDDALCI